MATKAISASTIFVSDEMEAPNPLLSAYRYRIIISSWTNTNKTSIVNILTNSITYANLTARQFNCLKYENGVQVVDFKPSFEEDENIKEIVKETSVKETKAKRKPGRPRKNSASHPHSVAA